MSQESQAQRLYEQGVIACRQGQVPRGLELFDQALAASPSDVMLPNRIGGVLMSVGLLEQAAALLQSTALRFPTHAGTVSNLGTILIHLGRPKEAAESWEKALSLDPNMHGARYNLASLLQGARQMDRSQTAFRELLSRKPDYADAWYSLGHIRRDLGDLEGALQCFARAIETERANPLPARSAYLYTLVFDDSRSWNDIVRQHVAWAKYFEPADGSQDLAHYNDRSPDRKLRVGYLSPFLLDHVISELIEPIFAHHDKTAIEVFAYCIGPQGKAHDAYLRSHLSEWRWCEPMSDDDLAALIRRDRIDVLVDLVSQMPSSRPGVIARKPAPVHINYLAYPATSGLRGIDYRVSCPQLDPPESARGADPDRLIRLPDTYWCYPTKHAVEIGPPPSESSGFVTFGCLNSFVKVRAHCLQAWGKILDQLPTSRLKVLVRGGDASRSVLERLSTPGIDISRVTLVDYAKKRDHFDRFNSIDVSLDTFPYGGHVTTHDSLWMGVPVVAMDGESPIARAGPCILGHAGLSDLVASDTEQYVRNALDLAADVQRRRELRQTLRQRMLSSPMTDAARFTQKLELGYRAAWRRWCERLPPADLDIA